MFLDRWEFRLVNLDGEPVDPADAGGFIFHSSGRVERLAAPKDGGGAKAAIKEDVLSAVALLARAYTITPEEFAAKLEECKRLYDDEGKLRGK